MAKVRTLARQFMKGHPRAGEPTYFVEKVLNALGIDSNTEMRPELFDYFARLNKDKRGKLDNQVFIEWFNSLSFGITDKKLHTIRKGHHFKTGDKIQLAVWSGKPYCSPQIRICPELEVVKTYDFEVINNQFIIDGWFFYDPYKSVFHNHFEELTKNDGLSTDDFLSWFKFPSDFKGQVICWVDPGY
ncbi:hypothetical protein [Pleomorphovibrio marinus]|uniref:hypothetical protein n=1 Tax=Pleomorphovibrio marinus TaxID=2164132 RepID=UPI000E0CA25E|nr:hypothetical protein [Pleomorphovibrio marinus]